MKGPLKWEEDITERLIDRAWAKHGPDSRDGWENWMLEHWPKYFSLQYWYYLFADLGDIPWLRLWSPITDTYEMRYWFKNGWRWRWIFEETKLERIRCRWRGHPEGEVYYNPGGFEPDHSCRTCGEEIG